MYAQKRGASTAQSSMIAMTTEAQNFARHAAKKLTKTETPKVGSNIARGIAGALGPAAQWARKE